MRPVAALSNVSFAFGTRTVLDHVSLHLEPGEILCLLGPNGAGKSTLIRLLTGVLKPASGEVAGECRQTSLVPQDIALYPWLTATENCAAFARYAGLSRAQTREAIADALMRTDCGQVADRQVRRLSGGYQRRINIAAALVARPRLLILDEPTVGVDLEARHQIAQIVRRVLQDGTAVLLVTHDFDEADELADRIILLKQGRVVATGAPRDLVARHFPDAKRIEIVMRAAPDARSAARLMQRGARPTGQGTIWQAFRPIADWDAGPFATELAQDGVTFAELRLRTPGIEALYRRFCTDQDAA
jgi:ABC-2 type transport system ATP-binding protein